MPAAVTAKAYSRALRRRRPQRDRLAKMGPSSRWPAHASGRGSGRNGAKLKTIWEFGRRERLVKMVGKPRRGFRHFWRTAEWAFRALREVGTHGVASLPTVGFTGAR
jgi:hypothetical protein